jgi:oxygen-independent coproporphyrinogen-3 oxidase
LTLGEGGSAAPAPDLGVYIHWPYCARICPYCDFAVKRERGRSAEGVSLLRAIEQDLRAQAAQIGPRRLVSIFFGGGTPSLMAPDSLGALVALCRSLWPQATPPEVTLETNPTDAESERLSAFAAAGVTRVSLGVQAFEAEALAFLGRNHTAADGLRAAERAAKAVARLSLDLIYGLPGQTPQAWAQSLQRAIDLGAEHLSPYELTIEPGTPFERAVRRGAFTPASPERGADLFETTQETLGAAGFEAYEVSNHARGASARCRHNLLYWRGADYLGVGPSAHGRWTTANGRVATQTPRTPADYIAAVAAHGDAVTPAEILSPLAAAQERLLMGLRCPEGLPLAAVAALPLTGLEALRAEGFVSVADGRLSVSRRGRLVLNRISEILGREV